MPFDPIMAPVRQYITKPSTPSYPSAECEVLDTVQRYIPLPPKPEAHRKQEATIEPPSRLALRGSFLKPVRGLFSLLLWAFKRYPRGVRVQFLRNS